MAPDKQEPFSDEEGGLIIASDRKRRNARIKAALTPAPPVSREAEEAILGAAFLEPLETLPKVMELGLAVQDFYHPEHQEIFETMLGLYNVASPVDLITVSEALKAKGALEKVGGAAYLAQLADSPGLAAHVASYASLVIDRAILRRLIGVSGAITEECYSLPARVEEVLDRAEASIYKVRDARNAQTLQHLPGLLGQAFARINALAGRTGGLTGIPTGYSDLDDMTGGFQKSDLIILAGRPSMGKTALALNLALAAARPQARQSHRDLPGYAVAVFSLEMSTEQLLQRLICQTGKLDLRDLRTGRLKGDDIFKLTSVMDALGQADVFIDDTPAIRVMELRAKARRLKSQLATRGDAELGLILIDYLQLMRGSDRADSREQEISEISRSLKALAKELNVPVVALSQLNRRVEERPDKRPLLSDLRESGAIEQDADLIAFVYREEVYKKDNEELRGKAELILGKQRNGPTGKINLTFLHQCSSFEPAEAVEY